ncbi:MAG: hypothetical protein JSV35_04970 [Candidatus Bathyarchaeota archaeon]|nr:MAG: hypothetical protein JSV35_04970 [Candidatus Bathyarchaeota archaeon]
MSEKKSNDSRVHVVKDDAKEVKEILSVVSTEVPGLIRNILASVFSEEAGRSMGKAAAAFYKELKEGGMPDPVAIKMTEEYMGTFTSLGDMLKRAGKGMELRELRKIAEDAKEKDEDDE